MTLLCTLVSIFAKMQRESDTLSHHLHRQLRLARTCRRRHSRALCRFALPQFPFLSPPTHTRSHTLFCRCHFSARLTHATTTAAHACIHRVDRPHERTNEHTARTHVWAVLDALPLASRGIESKNPRGWMFQRMITLSAHSDDTPYADDGYEDELMTLLSKLLTSMATKEQRVVRFVFLELARAGCALSEAAAALDAGVAPAEPLRVVLFDPEGRPFPSLSCTLPHTLSYHTRARLRTQATPLTHSLTRICTHSSTLLRTHARTHARTHVCRRSGSRMQDDACRDGPCAKPNRMRSSADGSFSTHYPRCDQHAARGS
jgi:hypothetical protein